MFGADRMGRLIWGATLLFLTALAAAAVGLIIAERGEELSQGEQRLLRFVASAEANANRTLVALDMTLASVDDLLGELRDPAGRIVENRARW